MKKKVIRNSELINIVVSFTLIFNFFSIGLVKGIRVLSLTSVHPLFFLLPWFLSAVLFHFSLAQVIPHQQSSISRSQVTSLTEMRAHSSKGKFDRQIDRRWRRLTTAHLNYTWHWSRNFHVFIISFICELHGVTHTLQQGKPKFTTHMFFERELIRISHM